MQKIETNNFINTLQERQKDFDKKMGGKKVETERQELGIEMSNWFETDIWWIVNNKKKYNLEVLKYGFGQCQKYEKRYFQYLLTVLNSKLNAKKNRT